MVINAEVAFCTTRKQTHKFKMPLKRPLVCRAYYAQRPTAIKVKYSPEIIIRHVQFFIQYIGKLPDIFLTYQYLAWPLLFFKTSMRQSGVLSAYFYNSFSEI